MPLDCAVCILISRFSGRKPGLWKPVEVAGEKMHGSQTPDIPAPGYGPIHRVANSSCAGEVAGWCPPSILLWVLLKEIFSESVIPYFQISFVFINIYQISLLALLIFPITVSLPSLIQHSARLSHLPSLLLEQTKKLQWELYFLWFACITKSTSMFFHTLLAPIPSL